MKVYIAARYERREEMLDHARGLDTLGHVSTARWLNGEHESLDNVPGWGGRAAEFALDDQRDIFAADWLVMFTDPPGTPERGGRHVEFGYALALTELGAWRVAIVGEPENIFHWLPRVHQFATWGEFIENIDCPRNHYERHAGLPRP